MKVALVIGASRGIGRQIALTFAKNGYQIGVAAKTAEESKKLPGTIYSVAEEINKAGGKAIPLLCNVRNDQDINSTIDACIREMGKLDMVIYNAGAITWQKVIDTPLKRFDLMNDVNVRGAYCTVQKVLPYFMKQNSGKILLVSPPIYSRFFKGKTPYSIGKVGMTILTNGLANELKETGVSITSLWPATVIESLVTQQKNVPTNLMRKADIFADACLAIAKEESDRFNGEALLDEDLLKSIGVSDFTKYRCDPNQEPPRMMPKTFPSLEVEEQDTIFPSKL